MHSHRACRAEFRPQRRFAVKIEIDVVGDGADLRGRCWQMHERDAGQMGVDDFDQWPTGRDLQNESCVPEKTPVADSRYERVLRTLDDFEPDCAAPKPRTE